MKARNPGRPEVPAEFRRENGPTDRAERSEWSRRRAEWYRANGYNWLQDVFLPECTADRAAQRDALRSSEADR